MQQNNIEKTVSQFISKTFLFDETKEVDKTVSLLGTGVIDSTGVLELISFLETTYNVKFRDEELVADNFDSIEMIKEFLSNKVAISG
jgi:acyl carrier protein